SPTPFRCPTQAMFLLICFLPNVFLYLNKINSYETHPKSLNKSGAHMFFEESGPVNNTGN
ncbi:MAG: hypothetical protein LC132_01240, partial [Burkholderiales bacterium]|nr:hypothetical protein [Burkholderiales bacterium]